MMQLTVGEILKATGGALIQGNEASIVSQVSTDTRKLISGDFYIALKGPRFDGHNFLADAAKKKCCGLLVSKVPIQKVDPEIIIIRAGDTMKAFGDLAWAWRRKFNIPVVAVTGSNGKTTTKEMMALSLGEDKAVLKTEGNLNNLIGLPQTLCRLDSCHRFAVLEMGMNALGEIARLTQIAEPTIGVVTNVGLAHLEGLKNIEGVARAKEELFLGLDARAWAVKNIDDSWISKMTTKAQLLTFGWNPQSDICCKKVDYGDSFMRVAIRDPNGETLFTIPLYGDHHVMNWLASYAVCFLMGIKPDVVCERIKKFKIQKMRGEELVLEKNILVINDSYNANPTSMEAALQTVQKRFFNRRRVAVLGEMLELGSQAPQWHCQLGKMAGRFHMDILLAFGENAENVKKGFMEEGNGTAFCFDDREALQKKLADVITSGDVVLVKGSRGAQMEKIVDALKNKFS